MTETDIPRAIHAWQQELGADNVAFDAATLDRYAQTTQDNAPRPACVLWPTSTEKVQAIVRIAGQCGAALYPISRGKNWGYGDACAPVEGAAIVDLSRMNRIIEINAELAYAVIEPGVSLQQLHEHLTQNDIPLWIDCTGAGCDASFVGNTLDRGFGHTRYGDHFLSACGMEIVLADGRVLNTGFTHYANARAGRVYRYGVGPSLDGLFCQSNFGIVTQIGMWLQPVPDRFCFFAIAADRDESLGALVDRLRPLRLDGTLTTAIHIGNDLRVFSAKGRYPWAEAGGQTPLPEDLRAVMRKRQGIGVWNAVGSLSGSAAHVRAAKRALRRAVRGLGRIVFVNDALLALGSIAASCLSWTPFGKRLSEQLAAVKPNYDLLRGVPTDVPLLGAEWRLRQPNETRDPGALDPACGLFWMSPVVPMTGRDARAVTDLLAPILTEHGFDALATFTLLNERAMIGIFNIAFDKTDPKETQRAVTCYDQAMAALLREGYVPYRTGLRGMPKLHARGDVFWEIAADIKRALDPHGIIAPGRYLPPIVDP